MINKYGHVARLCSSSFYYLNLSSFSSSILCSIFSIVLFYTLLFFYRQIYF